jgi:uncharacterized protein (DUF169 family)
MNQYTEFAKKIRSYLNPSTFPVAVTILKDESLIPASAKRPLKDMGMPMALCQGSAMARLYGWTVAFAKEDVGCGIAAHTYGWNRLTDNRGPIHFLTTMNYQGDEKAAAEAFSSFPLLEMGNELAVIYAPLEWTKLEPDIILIYVNPAQLMRLVHGATYKGGTPIGGSFSGRAGSCTEGVIATLLDNIPRVVLPGNGDRVWAACQDHEMIMALPRIFLGDLVEGLEKTHQKGIRYPIPSYLRYRPEIAFTIPLSDVFIPQEIDKLRRR